VHVSKLKFFDEQNFMCKKNFEHNRLKKKELLERKIGEKKKAK